MPCAALAVGFSGGAGTLSIRSAPAALEDVPRPAGIAGRFRVLAQVAVHGRVQHRRILDPAHVALQALQVIQVALRDRRHDRLEHLGEVAEAAQLLARAVDGGRQLGVDRGEPFLHRLARRRQRRHQRTAGSRGPARRPAQRAPDAGDGALDRSAGVTFQPPAHVGGPPPFVPRQAFAQAREVG